MGLGSGSKGEGWRDVKEDGHEYVGMFRIEKGRQERS